MIRFCTFLQIQIKWNCKPMHDLQEWMLRWGRQKLFRLQGFARWGQMGFSWYKIRQTHSPSLFQEWSGGWPSQVTWSTHSAGRILAGKEPCRCLDWKVIHNLLSTSWKSSWKWITCWVEGWKRGSRMVFGGFAWKEEPGLLERFLALPCSLIFQDLP